MTRSPGEKSERLSSSLELGQENSSTLGALKAQIGGSTHRALLAAGVSFGLAAGAAAQDTRVAQAETNIRTDASLAVITLPEADEASEGLTIAERQALRERLAADLMKQSSAGTDLLSGDGIPEGIRSYDVVKAVYTYGEARLQLSLEGFFAATNDSTEAAIVIYPILPAGVQMAIEHREAIMLGRETYIREAILRDERYQENGRLSQKRIESRLAGYQERYGGETVEEIQKISAGRSFDHIMMNVLNGKVSSADAVQDLTDYATSFVKVYLMNPEFRSEFPQDILRVCLDITNIRAETAEIRAETAEIRAETAEIRAETAEIRAETAEIRAETRAALERIAADIIRRRSNM